VSNDGKLKAKGGRVELTAAAARQVVDAVINTTGVIEANSVGTRNGQIVLSAATRQPGLPKQTVKISGKLTATGRGDDASAPANRARARHRRWAAAVRHRNNSQPVKGGTIVITGEHIEVAGATIDASGREGGGKVMIGGDWGGGKPDKSLVTNQSATLEANAIPTATTVSVDAATKIDASAKDKGDGGKMVLWRTVSELRRHDLARSAARQFGNGGIYRDLGKVDRRHWYSQRRKRWPLAARSRRSDDRRSASRNDFIDFERRHGRHPVDDVVRNWRRTATFSFTAQIAWNRPPR
jgi:hypothetical protein